jgi:type IV pilus assembly protein PilM
MPAIDEKEMTQAIEFEARKYIPIPLSEVALDWKVVGTDNTKRPVQNKKILLIAVPKEVVNKYIKIAEAMDLRINALELESISFSRVLAQDETSSICILDIGARATSCTIIDQGTIQISHGLDIAGAEMTKTLASSLGIAFKRAENFKLAHGIDHEENSDERKETKEVLVNLIDEILNEGERMINGYQAKTKKKVEKIILNGGSARMEGLKEYTERRLNIKTFIANPWSKIVYPASIESTLKEIGPQFSVAIGAAMREE